MSFQSNQFCPYCLSALIGAVVLAALPDHALAITPMGPVWIWLLAIPICCAVIRSMFRRAVAVRSN